MCSTTTAAAESGLSLGPYRRTRSKTRKPKFVSLQQELFSSEHQQSKQHHQLNLFPLHPENLYEEKDVQDNVAYLFDPDGGGATLAGLLGSTAAAASPPSSGDGADYFSSPSSALTHAYSSAESDGASSLERAALRRARGEREASEEKWVAYSDVATAEEKEEIGWSGRRAPPPPPAGLSLKLDYEQIMNAWSDKGPLYIEGEGAQIVPDHDHSTVRSMVLFNIYRLYLPVPVLDGNMNNSTTQI